MTDDESPRESFAVLRLDGDRFAGGRLPIDALIELQRYRAILLAAAERAYLAEHPGQSIPEDFSREFDLAIDEVQDGSATNVLERPVSVYDTYYDSGKKETDRLFADVTRGLELTVVDPEDEPEMYAVGSAEEQDEGQEAVQYVDTVPDKPPPRSYATSQATLLQFAIMPEFQDFGSSLQPDEAIAIPAPDDATTEITAGVRMNRFDPIKVALARRIVVAPTTRSRTEGTVAGRLIGLNAEDKRYTLKTLLYGKVNGKYRDASLTADLRRVLDSSSAAPVIRITGRLSWRNDQLDRINEATGVELFEVEGSPWGGKLIELASLPKAWSDDGHSGSVISFAALDAARELLDTTHNFKSPAPGVFPLEDGGVQLEWASTRRVTSVEISADASFVVHSLSADDDEGTEVVTHDLNVASAALVEVLSA